VVSDATSEVFLRRRCMYRPKGTADVLVTLKESGILAANTVTFEM
jgi:hypothetical protein